MKHPRLVQCICVFVLLLCTGLLSPVGLCRADPPEPGCFSRGWPHDGSDLQPDPALRFGRLDNGLRYVMLRNTEPRNRVAMYLNIQSGSLHETEEQRGLAHFLEHMLFNGTTHYPPGMLIEYLQRIGMGFGNDTNAHTGYDETVYNLFLPTNTDAAVTEACTVLADYARGALLLESEVDRERGVILAEKRARDTAASRVMKAQLRFDFSGTRVAEREPIGVESVLTKADSALLRSYYDQWYRPENMIVVVVGDMDPQRVEPLLRRAFSELRPAGAPGVCPDLGRVEETGGVEALVFSEPELGYTSLALTTVFNAAVQKDGRAWQRHRLHDYLAMSLLQNRLEELERRSASPLVRPRAGNGYFVRHFGYATLLAQTEPDKWRQGLTLLQTTLSQALRDGFTEGELIRGKRDFRALLEKAVQTQATRDSREVASDLLRKLNDGEIMLSPQQEVELYGPMLDALELAEINTALRELWGRSRRLVKVTGKLAPELDTDKAEQQVLGLFAADSLTKVAPWVEQERASFPYLPAPEAASKVDKAGEVIDHPAIGASTHVLPGGVRVNVKSTDFQANQILLSIRFGQGKQGEPAPGLALLGEAVLTESGLGRLTRTQLDEALAGSNIQLAFKIRPESFDLQGECLTDRFEQLLQLAYHQLHDPAFRPVAFDRVRGNMRQMYRQLSASVEGAYQTQGLRFLVGENPEYSFPSWSEVEAVRLEQIRDWLEPALRTAPLEINVVGDIAPEEAVRLVGRYFGVERRRAETGSTPARIPFPVGKEQVVSIQTAIDKGMLMLSWQTDDFWEIDRNRQLNLLAAVFDDRLRVTIRQKLGATYAPQVMSRPSRCTKGFGLMQAGVIVDPKQIRQLAGVVRETAADMGRNGVSEDELRRAVEPVLTSIADNKRTNLYWLETVLALSSRYPQQLEWPLSITQGFASIRAEELSEMARRYLSPDKAATLIIVPEAVRPAGQDAAGVSEGETSSGAGSR
ncbi:MAG: M16 family metallopeptidase [Desulfobulbus sp.]|jgi:zinc protease